METESLCQFRKEHTNTEQTQYSKRMEDFANTYARMNYIEKTHESHNANINMVEDLTKLQNGYLEDWK